MRLIDADALLRSHCSALDGEYESCEECLKPPYGCCCLEIKGEDIYNAPTIEAIPVEVVAKKLQRSFHSENLESWAEWLRGNYTDEDFVAHKDDKHNAIPVEWLENRLYTLCFEAMGAGALYGDRIGELAKSINEVMKLWEKEQEEHCT